jgi:hypothetical protein
MVPILFGVSLAFTGALARNLARSVFLFFALFLGPLSFGLCSLVLVYQLVPGGLHQPLNAQAFLLCGEALLTSVMVTAIALWLFPGIRAATEPEKREANLGRLVLATVLLLGVFASGLQAFILSLTGFGGPATGTATLALLDYENLMTTVPVSSGSWFQLGIVTFFGLVSGILVVRCNLRFSLNKMSARPQPAGCAIGVICGLILFFTALIAVIPIFASSFELVGSAGGSALAGLTVQQASFRHWTTLVFVIDVNTVDLSLSDGPPLSPIRRQAVKRRVTHWIASFHPPCTKHSRPPSAKSICPTICEFSGLTHQARTAAASSGRPGKAPRSGTIRAIAALLSGFDRITAAPGVS